MLPGISWLLSLSRLHHRLHLSLHFTHDLCLDTDWPGQEFNLRSVLSEDVTPALSSWNCGPPGNGNGWICCIVDSSLKVLLDYLNRVSSGTCTGHSQSFFNSIHIIMFLPIVCGIIQGFTAPFKKRKLWIVSASIRVPIVSPALVYISSVGFYCPLYEWLTA